MSKTTTATATLTGAAAAAGLATDLSRKAALIGADVATAAKDTVVTVAPVVADRTVDLAKQAYLTAEVIAPQVADKAVELATSAKDAVTPTEETSHTGRTLTLVLGATGLAALAAYVINRRRATPPPPPPAPTAVPAPVV